MVWLVNLLRSFQNWKTDVWGQFWKTLSSTKDWMPEEEGNRQRKALINYFVKYLKGWKDPDSRQSKLYPQDGGILLLGIVGNYLKNCRSPFCLENRKLQVLLRNLIIQVILQYDDTQDVSACMQGTLLRCVFCFNGFIVTGVLIISFIRLVRNTAKSDLVSPCLFFCPQGTTRLPLDVFSWHLIFEYFSRIFSEKSIFIKMGQE